ncbi:adenosine deaminase/editase [Catenaria anguillulae PL171]|uniref:Adenosine deaminase/editase n=1 Tax=Catenaria anguillulae PL171 TaxID=765915 RepID=A0A1Y2HPN6_9FUNG|nr:adenosine deaminase/editase [Catenaria anguillulae PL171]
MYISQAPCAPAFRLSTAFTSNLDLLPTAFCLQTGGDASLEALSASSTANDQQARDRTEHKRSILLSANQSDAASIPMRGRNVFDLPCVLRTKPGRNDSIPTRSLSCSDKLASWQCLGLQGALLSTLIPDPISLASIVIGDHFHHIGLERALVHRVYDHVLSAPLLLDTRLQFAWSQEYVKEAAGRLDLTVVTPSHGFTWWSGGKSEYIVNGRKQGAAAGKDGRYLRKTWSQVSKPVWFSAWTKVALLAGWSSVPRMYADAKNLAVDYQERKRLLLRRHPVFSSWVGNDPKQVDHFEVDVDAM